MHGSFMYIFSFFGCAKAKTASMSHAHLKQDNDKKIRKISKCKNSHKKAGIV